MKRNLIVETVKLSQLRQLILAHRPAKPLYICYPDIIAENAVNFLAKFPGKTLYAVKTNPEISVITALISGGVSAFDVASFAEIQLIKTLLPNAELHFMNPVKAPEDIRTAYFDYGVRNFVFDHHDELLKIMRITENAQDLNLTLRIALPKNNTALIDFSSKFGASFDQALALLQTCRPSAKTLGLSFHVGTQTTDASCYAKAIAYCAKLIKISGVTVDSLNVGGGFPVVYVGDEHCSTMEDCIDAIEGARNKYGLSHLPLLAEPGRILTANGAKLVTRVELRKDKLLYINDGVYGGLFDAASWVGTRYPVHAISSAKKFQIEVDGFKLAGPTCDSLDLMPGPFILPSDIGTGDWIVFDNCGAYSQAMRSDFNGLGYADVIHISQNEEF